MIAENNDYNIYIHNIEYHLLKIDALYAALITEILDMISKLHEHDALLPLKLLSHQHVYLEQIAAHRAVISYMSQIMPFKKLNYYRMQGILINGELATINTLMRCISEKIGFMMGVDNQSNQILAEVNLSSKWHYRLLLEHKREQDSYFRKPLLRMF